MLKKWILLFFCFFPLASLKAASTEKLPELPNIITFLNKIFYESPFFAFLHEWENIFFSLVIAIGLSLLFTLGIRKKELMPTGLQNFVEWVGEIIQRSLVEIIGPEGKKYVPFLGTLFIYILTMNFMILIPFMKPPSSSINITIALAICVFVLVQYLNIKNWGLGGFLYHLAGEPKTMLGWLMVPILLPVELLTQLTRPLTLALRLFGNVFGEDILIGAFALFGVLLLSDNLPIGLPLQIPFMFLAILTGLMQALVFTLLSAVYILLSMPGPEHNNNSH